MLRNTRPAALLLTALTAALPAAIPTAAGSPPPAPPQQSSTQPADAARRILLRDALVIGRVGRAGRTPFPTDGIAARLADGTLGRIAAGEEIELADGSKRTWQAAQADENGWLQHDELRGGYAAWQVESDRERVAILHATGPTTVYVNGQPRAGDPYQNGLIRLPVGLRKGANQVLAAAGRGRMRIELVPPAAPVMLEPHDATLPDLLVGEPVDAWGAVFLTNATTRTLRDLSLASRCEGGSTMTVRVTPLPPLSARKVAFRVAGPPPDDAGQRLIHLELRGADESQPLATCGVTLNIRRPDDLHSRTFISDIDGSVQYYAVLPARPAAGDPPPAIILSLHGASVEARGQAAAYAAKRWAHVVAPTNRRPFGFDWEDWGRLDALEVLEHAAGSLPHDPARIYLTGHSMGGHGTWHLGVTFPDRFAAIGPSAGWISFWSYAGAEPFENASPVEQLLRRAVAPSDTLSLQHNLAPLGIYILHGDADDNVPVDQARQMKEQLAAFHRRVEYHEQPGAGHWWDASDEPGACCVDWAPMMDFFARCARPPATAVRHVRFSTANPAVSARCDWATIAQQTEACRPSRVELRLDPHARRFAGTTENVASLALSLVGVAGRGPLSVELDGQKLGAEVWPAGDTLWLRRDGEAWRIAAAPPARQKSPHRGGPFKQAFANRMIFVYGTGGTPDEAAWAAAKARYDAETFWYRGNGAVEVVADTDFDAAGEPDRNVILYGHAGMNAAWAKVLDDCPIRVAAGRVRLGERELAGDDLGVLFVYPRADSDEALIGVVAGTGPAGLRSTERLPYFVSGVGYPDCVIFSSDALRLGASAVRAAGFFGNDWSVESGQFEYTEGRQPDRQSPE